MPAPAKLTFRRPMVVVGGGTLEPALLRALKARGAHIVGADGGADAAASVGATPEAIIGDLDSLSDPNGWAGRARVLRIAEQDTTDFEKVLYSTEAPVTIALGMTGGRFDHTLAALDAVTRHAPRRRIILVDAVDLALAVTGPFAFAVGARERVSIHPLGPVRFEHSEGLRYPLDGLRLAPGERTGTSNEAISGPFSIVPAAREGQPWLLILPVAHLFALTAALCPGWDEVGPEA